MAPLFWFEVQLSINEGRRGQVLSFLGIVLSAAIALSSTTFIGIIMAGIISGSVFPRAGSGLTRSRH